jgi:hypothetical protein
VPANADDRNPLVLCGLLVAGGSALILAGLILNPPLALLRRLTQ